jgi:putative phage-type endonuclease
MSSAPAVLRSKREAWLAERRNHIGASDVAAILGVDPYRGPLAVYAAKVGDIDQHETRWMRWGRLVEGAIAEGFSYETERPVADLGAFEIQRHPDLKFLAATLDRVTQGSEKNLDPMGRHHSDAGPLECKAVAGFKAKDWKEEPPLHFQVQLQAQLACTGAQWGCLVALLGGVALAWRDLQRDDSFLAAALPKLEAFWMNVQRRQPPEADGLPGTSDAIKALWSEPDGETVALGQDAFDLVEQWESAKALRGEAEGKVDELENKLRTRMGSATFGALLDGRFLTLKKVERAGFVAKPTSYRSLRLWRPRLHRR